MFSRISAKNCSSTCFGTSVRKPEWKNFASTTYFRTMVRKHAFYMFSHHGAKSCHCSQIFTRLPPLVSLVSFFTRLSHLFSLVLLLMDKSWMNFPRTTCTYLDGLEVFLNFATMHGADCYGNIICPCPKCNLRKWQPRQTVQEHLVLRAFPKDYIFWHLFPRLV